MRLEDGKYYRTRDGRKVGPMRACGASDVFFSNKGTMWYSNGDFYPGMPSEHDIVAEWVDNDHIDRTKRMIEVMQAYVDGEEIEFKSNSIGVWKKTKNPGWYWNEWDYRIAETPDSINWDHVAPEFKYMERRPTGEAYLYTGHPDKSNTLRSMPASVFSSYRKGTCNWKDSLVIRPGCE